MDKPIIVIKIGGATLGSHDTALEDAVNLQKRGFRLLIVHGGAKIVNEWLSRQDVPVRFVRGERVTDEAALEMVTAVLGGLVNKEITAAVNNLGGRAVGISGIDGSVIQGSIRDKEMGYVARVAKVDTSLLKTLLEAGYIPVMASLGMHSFNRPEDTPNILNLNGDTIAGEIAAAIGADRLIFLTDVAGIKDADGNLIPSLSSAEAEKLIESGLVKGGMIPKVRASLRALSKTAVARIIDGRQSHALLKEIENGGVGTTIKTD